MRAPSCLLVVALSVGCAPSAELYVDLYTDFVPVAEFDTVSIAVSPDGAPTTFTWRHAMTDPHERYLDAPRRFALGTFTPGAVAVEVRLDHRGRAVVGRWTPRTLPSGATVLRVHLLRGCRDVSCPSFGDFPDETECDNGACVVPDCEERGSCADDVCTTDDECAPPLASCAEARCLSGRCAYGEREGACSVERYCDPDAGCLVIPSVDTLVFHDLIGVSPGIEYESNEIIATVGSAATATVSGDPTAQLLIDGRAVGRSGTVRPGDRVRLRMSASSATETTVTATLAFGGMRGSWNVTTGATTCAMTTATIAFTTAGAHVATAPEGCGHASLRLWGAGGAGGRSDCGGWIDGAGGAPTIVGRATGEILAIAGGGGGGTRVNSGASGAYVELAVTMSAGESLMLEVGAGGLRNTVDGGGPGTGPYGGPVEEGGRGLGDLVVPGNPPRVITGRTPPPYPSSPTAPTFGYGGRSDNSGCDVVENGGVGRIELRWGY